MRIQIFAALFTGLALTMTGCASTLIAESGRRIDRYENRAEVRRALGKPRSAGWDGAERYEDYQFRGKIAERGEGPGMMAGMTLGLSEFIFVPLMLANLPRQVFEQHEVRYYFDSAGKVTRHEKKPATH